MALKQVMITRKISGVKEKLESLREKTKQMEERETQLEEAINEAQTEEELEAVEKEIEDAEREKQENEEEEKKLEEELEGLEEELERINQKLPSEEKKEERKRGEVSMKRNGIVAQMAADVREDMLKREDVKTFLAQVRSLKGETRGVSGSELLIPEVMLELLRDNIDKYSKLITLIRLKPVSGIARQNIAGTIPEAIWTEAVATLNELSIYFNQIEVDGFKVGGFVPVPNSTLEDSDLSLAAEIIEALGQAIGLAVDKAILYGTGKKMPLGIVTRLAQTVAPSDYSIKARTWENLSTSNILKLNIAAKTGTEFFSALILGLGKAKENYSTGMKFWCMNSTTKTLIMSKAITFDAAGTIVASTKDEMPVIGGKIVTLPFIADGEIIGGYGSLYLLAERKGGTFAASEHVKFIEDMTVFKGTARYDGQPIIPEGFVAATIKNVEVTKIVKFAQDTANTTEAKA